MANPKLLEHIKQRRTQNVDDQTIKNELISGGGWSLEDVEKAFSLLTPVSVPVKTGAMTHPVLKGVSALATTISIIFLVCLPVLLGLSVPGYLFSCALSSGGGGFDCRIGLPAVATGAAIGLIAGIKVSRSIIKTKTFRTSKIALAIFFLSVFGSYLIASLPSILDQDQRVKYLEGYSLESCSTGRPSVPWGKKPIDSDSCYAYFGMCESVKDSYFSKLACLKKRVPTVIDYSDCDAFSGLPGERTKCRIRLAAQKHDLDFCSTFTDSDAYSHLNPYLPRVRCAAEASGLTTVYAESGTDKISDITDKWATPLEVKVEKCNALAGVSKDICLSYVVKSNKVNVCSGISPTIPWLKQNCEDLFKLASSTP